MSLSWMAWMATSNLVGAVIYAASMPACFCIANVYHGTDMIQVPERWAPYKFDMFGASHQLLHVMVMVAAAIHYWGLLEAFTNIRSDAHTCFG